MEKVVTLVGGRATPSSSYKHKQYVRMTLQTNFTLCILRTEIPPQTTTYVRRDATLF